MDTYIGRLKKLNFQDLLFYLSVCILCAFILCKPGISAEGAKKGIIFCTDILVPSLFPFMVMASFIVNTGIADKLGPFFSKITKKFFKLPGCTGSTILLSLIGGYPTGARGIKTLLDNDKITHEQARRMVLFCVGAGPAFVISAIGVSMLGNIYVGLAIFISQVISSIIVGIIVSRFSKDTDVIPVNSAKNRMSFSQALVTSCEDASRGIISICAFVVLFSSFLAIIEMSELYRQILEILKAAGLPESLQNSMLSIIFEVTGASYKLVNFHAPIEVLVFALGFGGLAVHFQIFSCIGELEFSKIKFMFFRCIHGIISAVIAHFLIYFIPAQQTVTVYNFYKNKVAIYNIKPSSVALIVLCCCFIITVTPKTINFNKSKKRGFLHDKKIYEEFKKKCKKKFIW